ncbi:hypothetical protein [Sphingomonas sp.]|nr:hypothetical protein [Sphingomonas sp.]
MRGSNEQRESITALVQNGSIGVDTDAAEIREIIAEVQFDPGV